MSETPGWGAPQQPGEQQPSAPPPPGGPWQTPPQQPGYPPPQQPGYQQPGYPPPQQPGYPPPAQPGYPPPAQPGYQQPGYPPPQQPGYYPPQQPGYQQPAYPQQGGYGWGTPMQPVQAQKLGGLATALTILLGIAGVLALLAAAALFSRASLIEGDFSISEVIDADDRAGGAVGFLIVMLLATGIVWLIWQFRHAKNAEALAGSLGLGPGWAIGGWFIPLGNYVLPQLQLLQAAKASDPDAATTGTPKAPGIVIAWWISYAASAILFGIGSATRPADDQVFRESDLADFAQADRIAGAGLVLMAGAAVVAILCVRTLTARQRQALTQRGMTA